MQKGFEAVNLHGTASGVIAVPVIGENGNWWIGNEDTGIVVQGDPGEQGVPGPQGLKGDKGDKGVAGPQGLQGIQGNIGAAGPQGSKGDKGESGTQGLKGEKGDTGIQGNIGPAGPQGERGSAGIQGPKGEDADRGDIERLYGAVEQMNSKLVSLLTWNYLGRLYETYKTLPSDYNEIEIVIRNGLATASERISRGAIFQWEGKYITVSTRYYDTDTSSFKVVDARVQISTGADRIAVSLVTVNDDVTSDYICDVFYR